MEDFSETVCVYVSERERERERLYVKALWVGERDGGEIATVLRFSRVEYHFDSVDLMNSIRMYVLSYFCPFIMPGKKLNTTHYMQTFQANSFIQLLY